MSGLVLGLLLLGGRGARCPEYCSCMWRRGKEAVVCRDTRFSQIPASIAPNTQVSTRLDCLHVYFDEKKSVYSLVYFFWERKV